MHWFKRALLALVTLAFLTPIARAGAAGLPASGVVSQDAPAVVAKNEPVPGAASNVALVGHLAPPVAVGGTTPAGQYSALAIAGDCAYIGRRSFDHAGMADRGLGVQKVSIADPAAPVYLGDILETRVTDSTARELRAIPQDRLLIVLQYSMFTGGGVNQLDGALSTGGSNLMQAFRINSDCSTSFLGQYDMGPLKPHEFYTWIDPKVPGRVIAYVSTPFGPGELAVFDFSSCSAVAGRAIPTACTPGLLTIWDGAYPQPSGAAVSNSGIGNYLHSLAISPDGRTGYMAFWNGGFFTVDTSQVADGDPNPVIVGEASTSPRDDWSLHNGPTGQGGDAHSAVWVPANLDRTSVKPYVILTDEDYLGIGDCPFGWMHIDQLQPLAGGLNMPVRVSSFGLPENTLGQEAAAVLQASRASAELSDPTTCAGFNRDHPGYIGTSSAWPGGLIPANAYTSHNPTTLPDLVLLTWYGGGFQVVNIHDPAKPSQAGFFVPTPEPVVKEEVDDPAGTFLGCYYPQAPTATDPNNCTVRQTATDNPVEYRVNPQVEAWSYPIIKDGLIYFVDNRNGLYVVSYSGAYGREVGKTRFAEGNSNNTAALIAAGERPAPPKAAAGTVAVAPAATAGGAPAALSARNAAGVRPGPPLSAAWLLLLLIAAGGAGLRAWRRRAGS